MKLFLVTYLLFFLVQVPNFAMPIRVDINANNRSDMQTEGWLNWQPGKLIQTYDGVQISLSKVNESSSLDFKGVKSLVVNGVTVGADGVIVSGEQSNALKISISGLAPGNHSFTGFHHSLVDVHDPYEIKINGINMGRFQIPNRISHDDDMGSSHLEFESSANQTVVIQISSINGPVILNGLALDISNPLDKALKPSPSNWDRHWPSKNGSVRLQWRPSSKSVRHHIYLASAKNWIAAHNKLEMLPDPESSNHKIAETEEATIWAPIRLNDSLAHYAWRVDTENSHGRITRGDVWFFRVRHIAFPGAEGYGRFAIGGRGGKVIHVTNLNNSGPGSLRAAVESTGPRTVVFDISGMISLKSKLIIRPENEFLTIAGQTAPGKGICIRNYTFGGLGTKDIIIRFIRLRLGDLAGETMDGMGLAACDHCIIDHCSISWSIDEAFSSRSAKNITFQRNIVSEALNVAGHSHYKEGSGHGYAGSISGDIGSFHHNLLAHNAGRNWSLAGAIDQANKHAGRLDIRNMIVYNWHHRTTDGGARQVNFVNNYFKPGPASRIFTYLNPHFQHPAFGPQQYFVSGNIVEGFHQAEGPSGPLKGLTIRGHQNAPATVLSAFFPSYVSTHSASESFNNVLADVGCNVPKLDEHDQRIILETRTGTTKYNGSKSGLPGIPDSQSDVGGWEDYPVILRPANWDHDRDGIPSYWENLRGLDPDDISDGSLDPDGNGYTNLEEYLNWLIENEQ